ncbi:DUF2946 domain-containing protein [Pseudomonas sp. AA-38]|uniref:DUF2946 domain-containing protein n=1 Tax=Pseudomonas sp. AA-38 TaxID=3028807 RepID=UPI0023F797A8|nr:DUF2946 domain-containing protein [Pseudomonas sp. AA-38]
MRPPRSSTAWLLYFSVLFAALACAISHGQMAGMQLSGLEAQYCAFDGNFGAGADLDGSGSVPLALFGSGGCAIASSFSAILLVAFFGLFGLLDRETIRPLPRVFFKLPHRHRWPSLNPRASPRT